MTRPGLKGGMITKTASQSSPRRTRGRLNSRGGAVQNQISLWNFIESGIAKAATNSQPVQHRVQAEPSVQPRQPANGQTPQQVQHVNQLVQQIEEVSLGDTTVPMEAEVEQPPAPLQTEHQGPPPGQLAQQGELPTQQPQTAGPPPLQTPQGGGRHFGEETLDLSGRVNPVIPGPLDQIRQDEEGWGEIDRLGAWDCALSPFQAIEEVPAQHREVWALAMDRVHRRVWEAQEDCEELDRALKWWFFLPQALCRRAQRGGRAGIGQIKKRFNSVVKGDYGELVQLWLRDMEIVRNKEIRKSSRGKPASDMCKKTRQAVSLISKGFISKASNRMISHGVANIDDPTSKAALASKYPTRGNDIPATVSKGQCVDTMKSLRDSWLSLKGGVAPGTGQLRPEFLVTLAEVWDENSDSWDMVNSFAMRHVNGDFPPWYYKVCMSVETVGMYKTAAQDPSQLRPIGMKNPYIKEMHKQVIKQNRPELTSFLEPTQLGMSVAGGAKLVHSVRMLLEENRDFICIKLDFRNAFNEVSRSRVITALENEPSLRHLASHAATILAPSSGLESRGVLWGESQEGVTQGDPESGPYFCVAIQEYVTMVDTMLAGGGGCARFGWDDGYLLGPTELTFAALDRFTKEVEEHCGLVLQRSKTEVFTWLGELPACTPPDLVRAGTLVGGKWEAGMICYGVPVGTDSYVCHMLDSKVNELTEEVNTICQVLEGERQSLWAVLRSSTSQKLDYWLTLVYPSLMKSAAAKMDTLMARVLEGLVGMHIPMVGEGLGWDCPLNVPIEGLETRTFQQWTIRQPVKMGGLGLRSQVELSPAAFIGGIEQALPHFVGSNGICQQLAGVLGGGQEQADRRWFPLLQSGCRTGVELSQAWSLLQREATQCAEYLGQELVGPLAVPVEGVGEGAVDGRTRKLVVQDREELRGAVMKVALSRLPDQQLRPVTAWPNRDKLSASWLQCLPGPEGLGSPAFSEALALLLCMPSPACQERVGAPVGRTTVDIFGDRIMSQVLPGDHWRTRHDKIKMAIHSLCIWARVPVTVEVFGLFSHLIPAQALTRMEKGRKRQALVPDFRLELPCPTGGTKTQLAELKIISCCKSWYTPGSQVRGTDKRAQQLPAEYRRKAKTVDQEVIGVDRATRGPVERRLEEFGDLLGLCFGAWGEASEGVHQLVQYMAEKRVDFLGLQRGRPGSEEELGRCVGQIRRRLSMVAIKGQVDCLLSKLHQVGPGNGQLAKKRVWAVNEDQRMAKERGAQWIRRVEGVYTLRKGFFKTA